MDMPHQKLPQYRGAPREFPLSCKSQEGAARLLVHQSTRVREELLAWQRSQQYVTLQAIGDSVTEMRRMDRIVLVEVVRIGSHGGFTIKLYVNGKDTKFERLAARLRAYMNEGDSDEDEPEPEE